MKRQIILALLCIGNFFSSALSQQFQFYYDAAGNRYERRNVSLPGMATELTIETRVDIYDEETGQLAEDFTPEQVYNDILGEQGITVYPNPTRGEMVVRITNMQQNSPASIILFNTDGREVLNLTNVKEYSLVNISDEPDGIYIMKIAINGKTSEWKVVKE